MINNLKITVTLMMVVTIKAALVVFVIFNIALMFNHHLIGQQLQMTIIKYLVKYC